MEKHNIGLKEEIEMHDSEDVYEIDQNESHKFDAPTIGYYEQVKCNSSKLDQSTFVNTSMRNKLIPVTEFAKFEGGNFDEDQSKTETGKRQSKVGKDIANQVRKEK